MNKSRFAVLTATVTTAAITAAAAVCGIVAVLAAPKAALAFDYKPVSRVISEVYADNLLATFGDIPVVDLEIASLFSKEEAPFTLKDDFKVFNLSYTVPSMIKAAFAYNVYDGAQRRIVPDLINYMGHYTHTHPFHRLEEMRQISISFKPEPDKLKQMFDKGTTLYPLSYDRSRSFGLLTTATSENRLWGGLGSEQHPGIRQILFFNKDGYQTLDSYEIKPVTIDMMEDYRKANEKFKDDRSPLKIAAWLEKKLLMPFGSHGDPVTWTTPKTTVTLVGGESVGDTVIKNRRQAFLQENIVEAIKTAAYIQLKTGDILDFLGRPHAPDGAGTYGVGKDKRNLMTSLVGDNVTFDLDLTAYRFKGDFMSGNKGANVDINSDIKANFVARNAFSQLLSTYQQVLAARLKLLAAASLYNSSPKTRGDDSGIGQIRQIYLMDKEERENIK